MRYINTEQNQNNVQSKINTYECKAQNIIDNEI